MRARHLLLLIFLGLLSLAASPRMLQGQPSAAHASPDIFASPIQAACVQVAPTVCKLHVDPFAIQIASGQRLIAFQLRANGKLLYDYGADVSNPPAGAYTPSAVMLDFAAACGATYTVNLLARDTGDAGFLNAGQAENVACPTGTYRVSLPLVKN